MEMEDVEQEPASAEGAVHECSCGGGSKAREDTTAIEWDSENEFATTGESEVTPIGWEDIQEALESVGELDQ